MISKCIIIYRKYISKYKENFIELRNLFYKKEVFYKDLTNNILEGTLYELL